MLLARELRLSPQEAADATVTVTAPDLPSDYTVRVVAVAAGDPAVATANADFSVVSAAGALLPDLPGAVRVGDEASVAVRVVAPAGTAFPATLSVLASAAHGLLAGDASGVVSTDVSIAAAGDAVHAVYDVAPRAAGDMPITFTLASGAATTVVLQVLPAEPAVAADGGFAVFTGVRAFDAALGVAVGPLLCEAPLRDTLVVTLQVRVTTDSYCNEHARVGRTASPIPHVDGAAVHTHVSTTRP